jgi:2-C-methyl-D-erythritol 4-phosphate cytidylyltransferase
MIAMKHTCLLMAALKQVNINGKVHCLPHASIMIWLIMVMMVRCSFPLVHVGDKVDLEIFTTIVGGNEASVMT